MTVTITNTPRPGESAEQTALRTAPRGAPSIQKPVPVAKLAYLTQPGPGKFVLNLQLPWDVEVRRVEISRAQLGNILVDGAAMAFRDHQQSVRLGAESFDPVVPDEDVIETARAADDLGREQNDAFIAREINASFVGET